MKKVLLSIFVIAMIVFSFLLYLYVKVEDVDILPGKYDLDTQYSSSLFYYRFRIYKLDKSIDLSEINDYPKDDFLIKHGFKILKWHKFNPIKDKNIIDFLESLIHDEDDIKASKLASDLVEQLKYYNESILFSQIGLPIYYQPGIEMGSSYFYFINTDSLKLYAFETYPHM